MNGLRVRQEVAHRYQTVLGMEMAVSTRAVEPQQPLVAELEVTPIVVERMMAEQMVVEPVASLVIDLATLQARIQILALKTPFGHGGKCLMA